MNDEPCVPPTGSLRESLERSRIELPDARISALESYVQLLWSWNERLNLTRHTDWDKFVNRDLLDSMHLAALLEPGEEILDVGTGGGVPGVLLAILRPDLQVSLADSVGKKAQAVRSIVDQLDLPITVFHDRGESVVADLRFDCLVARAVGPLWKLCKWFQPHWHCFGRLLAIKGPAWIEERRAARERGLLNGVRLRRVDTYPMPGTDSDSVILQLSRAADT